MSQKFYSSSCLVDILKTKEFLQLKGLSSIHKGRNISKINNHSFVHTVSLSSTTCVDKMIGQVIKAKITGIQMSQYKGFDDEIRE